jgi:hypothetical protein
MQEELWVPSVKGRRQKKANYSRLKVGLMWLFEPKLVWQESKEYLEYGHQLLVAADWGKAASPLSPSSHLRVSSSPRPFLERRDSTSYQDATVEVELRLMSLQVS